MYNPFSLQGKTILVTGASSGIGRATAMECARMGASVVVTGRNLERLDSTYTGLAGEGHRQIPADLSDSDQLSELVKTLPELSGAVFAAGVVETVPFRFVNRKKMERMFEVNFFSQTILAQQLIKNKLMSAGGSMVFVSSIDGPAVTHIGNSVYSATKGAVTGMCKGMALELASKNIRVNCIQPGMTDTPLIYGDSITREQLDQDKEAYPLERFARPEEIAWGAVFLLSDASSFTTGIDLRIDGGYTLK
ncbi:SDR family NAD(P)-dependent oxidoreductase [uncultured Rikenella sp.]|uniref:SDR family NAD(P)-dependent oxidoreductase n=1 Tax=uncultured Rikenella sp. TaxID=368003 RepID=UPI002606B511|nr:SDR family oxidoreductase [uncultured Rikenella sp.]